MHQSIPEISQDALSEFARTMEKEGEDAYVTRYLERVKDENVYLYIFIMNFAESADPSDNILMWAVELCSLIESRIPIPRICDEVRLRHWATVAKAGAEMYASLTMQRLKQTQPILANALDCHAEAVEDPLAVQLFAAWMYGLIECQVQVDGSASPTEEVVRMEKIPRVLEMSARAADEKFKQSAGNAVLEQYLEKMNMENPGLHELIGNLAEDAHSRDDAWRFGATFCACIESQMTMPRIDQEIRMELVEEIDPSDSAGYVNRVLARMVEENEVLFGVLRRYADSQPDGCLYDLCGAWLYRAIESQLQANELAALAGM